MAFSVSHAVLANGYRIASGPAGPTATVPYLVAWSDAFTFFNEVLFSASAAVVGPVSYTGSHRFPPAPMMSASAAAIDPCGCDGSPLTDGYGLGPGEYFTHAKITVTYGVSGFSDGGQPQNDPGGIATQLDPTNPITYCEQSVEIGGRLFYHKASGYEFEDGTAVPSDLAKVEGQARLVLTFPRVPFLPRAKVRPYVGKLNSVAVLGAAVGTLLFEGMNTQARATSMGTMGQQVQLKFTENAEDWNKFPHPDDGAHEFVYKKLAAGDSSKRLYQYADFKDIFL